MASRLLTFHRFRYYGAVGVVVLILIRLIWTLPGRVHATGGNPLPLINQPLVPMSVLPGSSGFTLTVNGTGFASGSVVNWNGSPQPTTFVSSRRLTAAIAAADVATAGTASVTVFNPAPGGGTSNVEYLAITHSESSVTFSPSSTSVAAPPFPAVVGDFNGDGKLDLAVGTSTGVSVVLGNGDGTFRSHMDDPLGFNPQRLSAGDFNGDGKLDLAVTGPSGVTVLLGNGDGTFRPPSNYSTGAVSTGFAISMGDFNQDGKLDLAVSNCNGLYCGQISVSVLLGNGDGTFGAPIQYGLTGSLPNSVTVGDFNLDDKLDMAVTSCTDRYCTAGSVAILLGNGDGTFHSPVTFPTHGGPQTAIVADFNGDGKLDLTVANQNLGVANENPTSVSVFLGKGDGTFLPSLDFPVGSNTSPQSMVAGDFNGDGNLDLGVFTGGFNVAILLGNGNGTFRAPIFSPNLSDRPSTVVAGDFNGDGRLDLAGTVPTTNSVAVLLQTSTVTLTPASLTFPNTAVGSTSQAQSVTLDNNTSSPLEISGVAVTGPFSSASGCGTSLAAFTSCAVSIIFKPMATGALVGALTITDSAAGSPASISLNGTGSDFSTSASPTSATVAAGQSATYTLSLAPVEGFNQAVNFSCSGAPSESTCLSPSPTTLDGTHATAATFTVNTMARASAWPLVWSWPLGGGRRAGVELALWVLALATLVALVCRTRWQRRWQLSIPPFALLVALWASCGGGGTKTPASNAGTPAGTYTLTLTATSGSLTHQTTVNLAVN